MFRSHSNVIWTCCAAVRRPSSIAAGAASPLMSSSSSISITSSSSSSHTALTQCFRFVQFEQTSQTIGGINKKDRAAATRWITKSTKDYMAEAARVTTANPMKDKLKAVGDDKKQFVQEVQDNADKVFDLELNRLQDYKQRKWKKSRDFFKRQGFAYTCLYLVAYFGCLLLFYIGFATGYLSKELAFGATTMMFQGWISNEEFYSRVEAWDTYINFGFAFVINESIEILRFPLVFFTYYTFRPMILGFFGRKTTKSMFRRAAAEQ